MPVVRPEFGPTLPQILGPRLRALPRWGQVLVGVGAALVAVLVILALANRRGPDDHPVVVREPVAFNFIYRSPMVERRPQGDELARLTGPGASLFTVRELRLAPYRGDSSGVLPVNATLAAQEMAKEYDGFLVRQEGRTNINKQQGYELVFQTRDPQGQLLYGRRVWLLPEPTGRQGADILLITRRSPAVPRADAVGRNGGLKVPLRSFRFGTERP